MRSLADYNLAPFNEQRAMLKDSNNQLDVINPSPTAS
jgi:hypothetical protein